MPICVCPGSEICDATQAPRALLVVAGFFVPGGERCGFYLHSAPGDRSA